jgi:hypothetical protein
MEFYSEKPFFDQIIASKSKGASKGKNQGDAFINQKKHL